MLVFFNLKSAKAEYSERISNYYRTSQYQNYIQAKTRWDQAEMRDEVEPCKIPFYIYPTYPTTRINK